MKTLQSTERSSSRALGGVQSRPGLTCIDLGRLAYGAAMEWQDRLVKELQAGDECGARLLLVEHDPPVITLGRRGRMEHVLASRQTLLSAGAEVYHARRGGQVTYHGPGQLVCYPILPLRRFGLTLRNYVHRLEDVLIAALRRFGIEGHPERTGAGVLVGGEKIAAIGVAVEKWVTYHGLALNVAPNLAHFDWIVPCGRIEAGITSMQRLLGRSISVSEVKGHVIECLAEAFGFNEGEIRHEDRSANS